MSEADGTPKRVRSLNVVEAPNAMLEKLRAAPMPEAVSHVEITKSLDLAGERLALHDRVVGALERVFDPEIPLNIYDLGLVYGIDIDEQHNVRITMTLTAPACPMADSIVRDVQQKVAAQAGVTSVKVELVWTPPWDKSRMSEAALLELGLL